MASTAPRYDVAIIGAGHNGLTCAAYLARKGYRVKIVERRGVVGGAAVTEEFHPGFRNSVCSYVVSLLDPKIIRDLELEKYGLTILERPSGSLSLLPDGRFLRLARELEEAEREIGKFSQHDAQAYGRFEQEITDVAEIFRSVTTETPPNIGGGIGDLIKLLNVANRARKLSANQQKAFARLMTSSIGDYLDAWFESDPIKGLFGFEAIVGNLVSPYTGGSAYVLIHHYFGGVNGKTGTWGYAKGGMGAITQAMARSAEAYGAEIEVNAPVREVILEGGRAQGVVLGDGRTIRARAVAANVNPKLLYLKLIDRTALPGDFVRDMEAWRCRSGSFRMNVALSELPRFHGLPQNGPERLMTASIDIAPSLAYLERAYDDAKEGSWAKAPIVSMCIPSILDETLAPKGCHVMSLFCQHFHPELTGGRTWDEAKDEAADLIIDTVDRYSANFKRSILGRQVLSPLDLEREFGLIGGDIFHGALHLDQIYSLRPAAGFADYRSPIKGLYHCGSGAHPGGGVSGLPGHNAAREIARDFRRRRVAA